MALKSFIGTKLVCVVFAGLLYGCAASAYNSKLSPAKEVQLVDSLASQMSLSALETCTGAMFAMDLVSDEDLSPSVDRFKAAAKERASWGSNAPEAKIVKIDGVTPNDFARECALLQNYLQFNGTVKEGS